MIYTKRGLVKVQEWGGEKKRERMGFSCMRSTRMREKGRENRVESAKWMEVREISGSYE